MKRYFFDVQVKLSIQYDFQGRDLEKVEQAREFAELLALDIECTDESELVGLEVQVRNEKGQVIFSIPVQDKNLMAA